MRPIDGEHLLEKLEDWNIDPEDVENERDKGYRAAMCRAIRLCKGEDTLVLKPEVVE